MNSTLFIAVTAEINKTIRRFTKYYQKLIAVHKSTKSNNNTDKEHILYKPRNRYATYIFEGSKRSVKIKFFRSIIAPHKEIYSCVYKSEIRLHIARTKTMGPVIDDVESTVRRSHFAEVSSMPMSRIYLCLR